MRAGSGGQLDEDVLYVMARAPRESLPQAFLGEALSWWNEAGGEALIGTVEGGWRHVPDPRLVGGRRRWGWPPSS
jgi:hypothetical protein